MNGNICPGCEHNLSSDLFAAKVPNDLLLEKMDLIAAFLFGDLDEEILMEVLERLREN